MSLTIKDLSKEIDMTAVRGAPTRTPRRLTSPTYRRLCSMSSAAAGRSD